MSNAERLAAILKKLGDAHYQAADELLQVATEQPGVVAVPSATPADSDDLPEFPPMTNTLPARPAALTGDQGSLAMCPKHRKPYIEGNFGPYCPSTTDDPAWANKKGYCRISPKNAAQWLRMQAA